MAKRSETGLCPDSVMIHCLSVCGGYSWVLTESNDKAQVRTICKQLEDDIGATLTCCTLQGLISGNSGDRDINDRWRVFVDSIQNDEYEQFENLQPDALKSETLLRPKDCALLRDLLQVFFDTGYHTDFEGLLSKHGVHAVLQSEG